MFTGIIQQLGRIERHEPRSGDVRLVVDTGSPAFLDHVQVGDSIAVNGTCLTAVELDGTRFAADVSRETLDLTTLGSLAPGTSVNLEKSLTPASPLGGHFVTGHVDGVGELVSLQPDARSTRLRFEVPAGLEALVAAKGSIAIDGVSLTVNAIEGRLTEVNIVPHTAAHTNLGSLQPGAAVNIEVDLLARYLARLVSINGYNQ